MAQFSVENRSVLAEDAISNAASLLSEGKVSEAAQEVSKAAFWLEEAQKCIALEDTTGQRQSCVDTNKECETASQPHTGTKD